MNLQELDAQRQTKQIAKVLENHSGRKINFDMIGPRRARGMLNQVQSVLKEHRKTTRFHKSETDPAYLNLLMMEQALSVRVQEADVMTPGAVGTAATGAAANPAQMGMQIAQRKKQLQDQLRAAQEQVRAIQKQLTQPSLGMAESRVRLRESEIQQAQVVLAAQDMVDQMQKMLEEISEMQFKDLPALTDSIRNDMGADQATRFQQEASATLTQLLASVQQGKTQLESAQSVLTGQAPIVPGDDSGATAPAVDVAPPADDLETDLGLDANMAPDEDEEISTSQTSLGRERR